jgi:metal-responsive CopG/Arc/MetJ family transcriptional regulator
MRFVGIKMDEDLLAWVDQHAKQENRSRSNMIVQMLGEVRSASVVTVKRAKIPTTFPQPPQD